MRQKFTGKGTAAGRLHGGLKTKKAPWGKIGLKPRGPAFLKKALKSYFFLAVFFAVVFFLVTAFFFVAFAVVLFFAVGMTPSLNDFGS